MPHIPWLRIQSSASPDDLPRLCGGQEPWALRRHLLTQVWSHSTAVCAVDKQENRSVTMTVLGLCPRPVGCEMGRCGAGQWEGSAGSACSPGAVHECAQVEMRLWEVLHTSCHMDVAAPAGAHHMSLGVISASVLSWCFTPRANFILPFWVTHLSLQECAQDGRICRVAAGTA